MSKKNHAEKKARRNNLADQSFYDDYKNSIPEDQIWDFQVEGLQKPWIRKPMPNARAKRIAVVVILVIAISISIFFSFWILHTDPFKYTALTDGGTELTRFSNPGELLELELDYAVTEIRTEATVEQNERGESERHTTYHLTKDETQPITALHEYAFNCDERVQKVTVGKTVTSIDNKSFYSCYALREIRVDPDNPNYCDVDGVLFNKDMTELICYPIDHDAYLREKYGYEGQYWPSENWKNDEAVDKYNEYYTREYEDQVNTYVVPETVKVIGPLAFNYAELFRLYLPEGLEKLETMAVFRNWHIERVDTYTGPLGADGLPAPENIKRSLPDSLTYIGSDCFNSAIEMDYMYIPANVTYIGHHAFWAAARNEGKGKLIGLYELHAALDQETFKAQVDAGDQWQGEYDNGLFPKRVGVIYGETRAEYPAEQ